MNLLDRAMGWLLLGFGVLHCGVTFVNYGQVSSAALWFFGAGLALIYGAALNLLRVRYAGVAPGVVSVSRAANVALLAFVAVHVAAKGAAVLRSPGAVILVSAVTLATAFSLFRQPAARRVP